MKRIHIVFPILLTVAGVLAAVSVAVLFSMGLVSTDPEAGGAFVDAAFLFTAPLAVILSVALAWYFWKAGSTAGFTMAVFLMPVYWAFFYLINGL